MSDLFHRYECTSTNDEIIELLKDQSSNFIGLYTLNQTNGRGQYGNKWASLPQQNLAYTMAVQSESFFISDFLFNFYTANCFREFIANLTEKIVKIKWPNDIICDNKKVSGTLIEKKKINNKIYYIIGIGINVLQEKFNEISNAGSLLTQTKKILNPENIAIELHAFLIEYLQKPLNKEDILEEFNDNLFKKNKISVFEINNTRQNGIIKNADENGCLWIELEDDGLKSFYHKEIKLLY